jgi:hypothetical protein
LIGGNIEQTKRRRQMKKPGPIFYVTICCLIVSLSGLLVGQDQHPRSATANIPFDFYISGNKLPAGQYSLDLVVPSYALLQSSDGKVRQDLYFLQIAAAGKNPPSKIVFAQRDSNYYFCEVWSWLGRAQLTSFTSKDGDQTKDVPLKPTEKNK